MPGITSRSRRAEPGMHPGPDAPHDCEREAKPEDAEHALEARGLASIPVLPLTVG